MNKRGEWYDDGFLVASIVAIIVSVIFMTWWTRFSYKECRAVGHSRTYCIVDMFR